MKKPPPFWTNLDVISGRICPYCHHETEVVDEIEIYKKEYSGRKYFRCKLNSDHYVGCYRSSQLKSLGRVADANLRALKMKCHELFDPIWNSSENKAETRFMAYKHLADQFEIPQAYCHFGMMDEEWCTYVLHYLETSEKSNFQ
jgi:hypothetical protein